MDKYKNSNDNSTATGSVSPTTGPSLTPPRPKRKSDKRTDATPNSKKSDSNPTL